MGYFSNGTEGMGYEEAYCYKCLHQQDCPIWALHLLWNYEQFKDETKATALEMLIPRKGISNEQCTMFVDKEQVRRVPPKDPDQGNLFTDAHEREKRIAWLQGVLTHTVWADQVPGGDKLCDGYQAELDKLLKEQSR